MAKFLAFTEVIKVRNNIFFLLLTAGIIFSCKEPPLPLPQPGTGQDPVNEDEQETTELTIKINRFIQYVMKDIYLWSSQLPPIDIRYEPDPKDYFDKLLFKEDKWSYITDDIIALEKSFNGVETTFGYSLAFGRFIDTQDIFAVVEYVYPGTPAANAGLKRGDLIFLMNSAPVNMNNYLDLLYARTLAVTFGKYSEDLGIHDIKDVSMEARELNLDPVLISDVIEHEGHKIGYLFYTQYIQKYNASLDSAFKLFLDEDISALVIDLRYNPGGVVTAAQYLCSSVAPLSVVNGEKTLVTYQWNDKYQYIWKFTNNRPQVEEKFMATTTYQLGLNKIYFLTGDGTASASELTITGLRPYMQVITVGETTYGKYTGSWTIKPEDYYRDTTYYTDFANWGLQPIILRFANSLGVTDFKDGFYPDIPAEDVLLGAFPLGDKDEPLLKKAIEDISGTPVLARKKAVIKAPYAIFDRGFSRFDANKRELLFDDIPVQHLDQK
ncbi:MAG: S41 family peptidase [Mariniphaga sp.]|nr:S41 family peptidase [Mariniphaga sp.]